MSQEEKYKLALFAGDCENFERCEDTGYYSAVCNRNDGGCGASTGYKPTIKAAVEVWNRREN